MKGLYDVYFSLICLHIVYIELKIQFLFFFSLLKEFMLPFRHVKLSSLDDLRLMKMVIASILHQMWYIKKFSAMCSLFNVYGENCFAFLADLLLCHGYR
jgi:hypothetical protein